MRRFIYHDKDAGGSGGSAGGGSGAGSGAGGKAGEGEAGKGKTDGDLLGVVKGLVEQVLSSDQASGKVRDDLTAKMEALTKSMADVVSARDAERTKREAIEQDLAKERSTRRADLIRTTLGLTDERVVNIVAIELGDKAGDVEKVRAWGLDAKNATLLGKATPASVVKDTLKIEDERILGLIVRELGADARDPEKIKAWARDAKNAALLPRGGGPAPRVPGWLALCACAGTTPRGDRRVYTHDSVPDGASSRHSRTSNG